MEYVAKVLELNFIATEFEGYGFNGTPKYCEL